MPPETRAVPPRPPLCPDGNVLAEHVALFAGFAALSALLLASFILFFHASAVEQRRHSAFLLDAAPDAPGREQREDMRNGSGDIRRLIEDGRLKDVVEAIPKEDGIVLRLRDSALFAPGSDALLPEGIDALNALQDIFALHRDMRVDIRSHGDDDPSSPALKRGDNWELSALRAARVLRHLLARGIEPDRLTATGLGEIEPLFPNTTQANRAGNRRMEFVLERRPAR
jgi:chemotaxis protein MotB